MREAYSVLAAKGLVLPCRRVGTRVRPKAAWNMLDTAVLRWHLEAAPTEEHISHLYELCHIVEPAAAALVAAAPSEATIEQIGGALNEMVVSGDSPVVRAI